MTIPYQSAQPRHQKPYQNIQAYWAWLIYLSVLIISFYIYSPALQHDYAWDDLVILFQPSGYLRNDWIHFALTEPFIFSDNYYRPLTVLSLFADFRLGNTSAFISHAINLSLLFINGLLILLIAKCLCQKLQLSIKQTITGCCFCLCFYLLHSSNLESAVWVSGRFDIMMTTFLLLALLADIKIQSTVYRIICVSLFFLMAALCKEMAAIFLPVLIVWHFMLENTRCYTPLQQYVKSRYFINHCKIYASVFITGIFYLVIRYYALGYLLIEEFDSASHYGDIYHRLATILKTLFLYHKVLLLPFLDSSIQYPQTYPVALNDYGALLGALLTGILFSIAIFARKQSGTLLLIPFILFIIAISPVLHILPLKIGANIIQERFLAFPITIFALALLPTIFSFQNKLTINFKKLLSLLFLCWCLISAANIHSIIPLWNNSLILWSWTYNKHKNTASALAFGQTLYQFKYFQEAYDLADTVKPKDGDTYLLQANSMLAVHKLDLAHVLYTKALKTGLRDKPLALALADYAYITMQINNKANVTALLNKSLALDSKRSLTHFYYAYFHYQQVDFKRSRESLQKAIYFSTGLTKVNASYKTCLDNINDAEVEYVKTGILPPASKILPY